MLTEKELHCGVYDSQKSLGSKGRTEPRTVKRYELELYHTDTGVTYVNGRAYPVRKGMLLCCRPGQERFSQLPTRCSYIWLLSNTEESAILETLPTCTYLENPQIVDKLMCDFTQLHSALIGGNSSQEARVTSNRLFFEILQICLQQSRGAEMRPVTGRLIRAAYDYMDKHFCESCTLGEIAAYVHISANHLHTVFLRSEGFTPYDYVMKKRLERAKTLILVGESSLAQIALETGFCSQSHFSAAFKKSTGQTPAQYRNQLFALK